MTVHHETQRELNKQTGYWRCVQAVMKNEEKNPESGEVKNKKELEGQEHIQNVMSLFFDTLTAP